MNSLGIFAKHPQPGKVKTRLAKDLGVEKGAELYHAFLVDIVSRFGTAFEKECVVCFSPTTTDSEEFFRTLIHSRANSLWPQPTGGLGTRLSSFFTEKFQQGSEKVIVIGSDSPTLPVTLVRQAFEELSRCECVLGPSTDGGFYLLGTSKIIPEIFQHIDWSTTRVLEQIVLQIEKSHASFSLLPPWYDVDSIDDLRFLKGHLKSLRLSGERILPSETIRFLDRYSIIEPQSL